MDLEMDDLYLTPYLHWE